MSKVFLMTLPCKISPSPNIPHIPLVQDFGYMQLGKEVPWPGKITVVTWIALSIIFFRKSFKQVLPHAHFCLKKEKRKRKGRLTERTFMWPSARNPCTEAFLFLSGHTAHPVSREPALYEPSMRGGGLQHLSLYFLKSVKAIR